MTPTVDFLERSSAYAALGWPVFPVEPTGKRPAIPKAEGGRGVHDATCDPARIEVWARRWPDANVGLACGVAFWALDVDYGGVTSFDHDGVASPHPNPRRPRRGG